MRSRIRKIFLLSGDVFFFYLSLYLALFIRHGQLPSAELWERHFLDFSLLLVVWLLIFYISNLYHLSLIVNNQKFLKTALKSFTVAVLISITFFYITAVFDYVSPRTNLAIFAGVFLVLFLVWRRLFAQGLSLYAPKDNLAIIGISPEVEFLIKEIKEKPHLGYKLSFIFDQEKKLKELNGIPVFNQTNQLRELIKKKKVKTIIIDQDLSSLSNLRPIFFTCLNLKVNFLSLPDFFESISGRIPIRTINQAWFLEKLNEGDKEVFDKTKRIYDLALSFSILLLTLPLYPLIAIIIKLESKGPVFFRQKRLGQNGEEFTIIKFRSMRIENNHQTLTRDQDDRITKWGSFLRKSRLDELPQVFNILKGEMSFVGPRPERPEFVEKLEKEIPFYRERMLVKPGLTGWDQISGEYHSPSYQDSLKKLQYDLFYIKNRSLFLDLSIILKTVSTVISKGGR